MFPFSFLSLYFPLRALVKRSKGEPVKYGGGKAESYNSATAIVLWTSNSMHEESTPLNKLAVADAVRARMPVDGLILTLA